MRNAAALLLMLAAVSGGVSLVPATGGAHPATLTSAEVIVEADGRFRMVAQFDTLAFALNDTSARIGNAPMEELLDGPRATLDARLAESRERFLHGFRVETDRGPGSVDTIDFPGADKVLTWKATMTPVLPVVLAVGLSGRLPTGAGTVAFRFPAVLEQIVLTVERPGEEPVGEQVGAGAASQTLPVRITSSVDLELKVKPVRPEISNPKKNNNSGAWILYILFVVSFWAGSSWATWRLAIWLRGRN